MYVGEKDTFLHKCKVQRCEKDVNPCIPNNTTKLVKMDTVNVDWKIDITFFLEICIILSGFLCMAAKNNNTMLTFFDIISYVQYLPVSATI